MRLSAHFDTAEFACHDGTAAPGHATGELQALCGQLLEPLRASHGPVTVISGYRTPAYNRAVQGAPHSYHVYDRARYGVAADVRCARGDPAAWARTLEKLGAGGLGRYSGHVHVDNRPYRARWVG